MSRLDEIEQKLAAAAPGPWRTEETRWPEYSHIVVMGTDEAGEPNVQIIYGYRHTENAELIANAPTDLRDLLAVAKAVRRLSERRPCLLCGGIGGHKVMCPMEGLE